MLVIIGLFPTYFAVNLDSKSEDIAQIAKTMPAAADLIERYGDDQKAIGVAAARKLGETFAAVKSVADIPEAERPAVRNDLDQVLSELKTASEAKGISKEDKETAKSTHDLTMKSVQYAPWWVRVLSALCLGLGTMVGYKRIVKRSASASANKNWRLRKEGPLNWRPQPSLAPLDSPASP
jgi:inorganic phosphate transporter, PiT family